MPNQSNDLISPMLFSKHSFHAAEETKLKEANITVEMKLKITGMLLRSSNISQYQSDQSLEIGEARLSLALLAKNLIARI